MGRGFRFIDHTGDVGIALEGRDPSELFRHAGEAFFSILTDLGKIRGRIRRRIELEANGWEDLLVRWLSEFNFLFETEGMLFRTFDIDTIDEHRIRATAQGEPYEEGRHPIKTSVKAVTYHQLRVRQEGGTWKVTVIFDI